LKRRDGKTARIPRTALQYHALPEKSKKALKRSLKVISKMRSQNTSLQKASMDFGTKPETVKRWLGSALEKRNGRFAAKRTDTLLRPAMRILTPDGVREIIVRGSRNASLLSEHSAAVQNYLATGDYAGLAKLNAKSIKTVDGTEIPLLTDRALLKRLGSAGVLSFESLYTRIG
jgi:hypothetical protein